MARCVLRTVEIQVGTLGTVDDDFAWDEGGGATAPVRGGSAPTGGSSYRRASGTVRPSTRAAVAAALDG